MQTLFITNFNTSKSINCIICRVLQALGTCLIKFIVNFINNYVTILTACNLYPIFKIILGVAGVFTSVSRICTRFFIRDLRVSTITFFMISLCLLAFCCILYPRIRKSDFVQFYISLCERDKTKITLEPREDAGLVSIYTFLLN